MLGHTVFGVSIQLSCITGLTIVDAPVKNPMHSKHRQASVSFGG